MSEKRRTSISLDAEVAEAVAESDENFSPLVNKWAREYHLDEHRPMVERERGVQMIEALEEIQQEQKELDARRQELFSRHKALLVDAMGGAPTSDEAFNAAVESVYNQLTVWDSTNGTIDRAYSTPRDPENEAIQAQASRLGVTPDHLAEELRRRDRRDRDAAREAER